MKICTGEACSIAGLLIEQFLDCKCGILDRALVSQSMRESLLLVFGDCWSLYVRGGRVQCQFALLCRSAWILKCVYHPLVRQHTRESFRVNKKRACVCVLGSQTGWLSIWWCANLWYLRPASGLSYYERHLVHMLFGLLASATSMWRLSYVGMRCAGDGNCTAQ
jgi:hypothetical protein